MLMTLEINLLSAMLNFLQYRNYAADIKYLHGKIDMVTSDCDSYQSQVQTLQQQNNELKNIVLDHEDTLLSAQEELQAQIFLNVDFNSHLQELTVQINDTQDQNEQQMH